MSDNIIYDSNISSISSSFSSLTVNKEETSLPNLLNLSKIFSASFQHIEEYYLTRKFL